jgi:hypothetical protein
MEATQLAHPAQPLPTAPARSRNGLGVAALVIGVASLVAAISFLLFRLGATARPGAEQPLAYRSNTSLFRCQGRAVRSGVWGLVWGACHRSGRFPAAGDYRLPGGRFKDALRAPLRGRAAPGS